MSPGPVPLLSVRDLSVGFATEGGVLRALDRVSFDVPAGRTVALVGESGCGKSVTALSLLRLVPCPPGIVDGGSVVFEGRDLFKLGEREMQAVRGARIAMVFQEPMTSLNPVYTVGAQIREAVLLHRHVTRARARARAVEVLRQVGFPEPETRIDSYPHELSGGMRQRVMIAMALACEPALLVADEPTSALDATVAAQILELLRSLRDRLGMSLLLIAHDLALVAALADEVAVLYAGQVVERGSAASVLGSPRHPYTVALQRSLPPTGALAYRERGKEPRRLPTIEGTLPDLRSPPEGCRFFERCAEAHGRCRQEPPPLYGAAPPDASDTRHLVRCFRFDLGDASGGGAT